MLRHAITMVKPGGIVVFSNCSLDPSEGEDMVAKVLKSEPSLQRVPASKSDFPDMEIAINENGDLRTTPDMFGGVDGFYATVLRVN